LDFNDFEIDHMIPRKRKKSGRIENLTPACLPCNRAKRNRDVKEFKEYIIKQSKINLNNIIHPLFPLKYKTNIQEKVDEINQLLDSIEIIFLIDRE